MISYQIWRALQKKTNRYHRRFAINPQQIIVGRRWPWPIPDQYRPWAIAAGMLALAFMACTGTWIVVIGPIFSLLLFFLLSFGTIVNAFILLTGTICGILSTLKVSNAIVYEREQGRFDLVSISPIGPIGMAWIKSKLAVRQSAFVTTTWIVSRGLYMFLLAFLLLLLGLFTLDWWTVYDHAEYTLQDFANNMTDFIPLVMVLILLYIDLIHSSVVGVVVGMLTGCMLHDRMAAHGLSLGLFLVLQALFYLAMTLIGLVLLPTHWSWSSIGQIVAFMGLFLFIRELLILGLWSAIANYMGTTTEKIRQTLHVYS